MPSLRVHFCLIQADSDGLCGWTRENGNRGRRWDTLHDSARACLMTDGQWPSEAYKQNVINHAVEMIEFVESVCACFIASC